jgi:hypothetical protein
MSFIYKSTIRSNPLKNSDMVKLYKCNEIDKMKKMVELDDDIYYT